MSLQGGQLTISEAMVGSLSALNRVGSKLGEFDDGVLVELFGLDQGVVLGRQHALRKELAIGQNHTEQVSCELSDRMWYGAHRYLSCPWALIFFTLRNWTMGVSSFGSSTEV